MKFFCGEHQLFQQNCSEERKREVRNFVDKNHLKPNDSTYFYTNFVGINVVLLTEKILTANERIVLYKYDI